MDGNIKARIVFKGASYAEEINTKYPWLWNVPTEDIFEAAVQSAEWLTKTAGADTQAIIVRARKTLAERLDRSVSVIEERMRVFRAFWKKNSGYLFKTADIVSKPFRPNLPPSALSAAPESAKPERTASAQTVPPAPVFSTAPKQSVRAVKDSPNLKKLITGERISVEGYKDNSLDLEMMFRSDMASLDVDVYVFMLGKTARSWATAIWCSLVSPGRPAVR